MMSEKLGRCEHLYNWIYVFLIRYPKTHELELIYNAYLKTLLQESYNAHKSWGSEKNIHLLAKTIVSIYEQVRRVASFCNFRRWRHEVWSHRWQTWLDEQQAFRCLDICLQMLGKNHKNLTIRFFKIHLPILKCKIGSLKYQIGLSNSYEIINCNFGYP